ncbi:MAG: AmmeMemoRadiSam system protein B [Persephonella sp.]|nr:MAG: AmmeMemoRadiSam system protein B [Persephonella sp.]
MNTTVRKPAVSNLFYPSDKEGLIYMLKNYLDKSPLYNIKPEALVSPHAGYIYSGEVAAVGYKQLLNLDKSKHYDVLLIGPSHYVPFNGVSFGYYDYWETPLGNVKVNTNRIEDFVNKNKNLPITFNLIPHIKEHSLEVQVPFLQMVLEDFSIIPVVYGDVDYRLIEHIIDYFKNNNTIVVISTDLSHYYPDEIAKSIDSYCNLAVKNLDINYLDKCEACGMLGLKAIIDYAKKVGWKSVILDYKTSGDTAGDKSAVVGYGSYAFYKD